MIVWPKKMCQQRWVWKVRVVIQTSCSLSFPRFSSTAGWLGDCSKARVNHLAARVMITVTF